jgi:hypothetical protein
MPRSACCLERTTRARASRLPSPHFRPTRRKSRDPPQGCACCACACACAAAYPPPVNSRQFSASSQKTESDTEKRWRKRKMPKGWPDPVKGKNMSSSAGDTVPSRGARILFLVRGHAITLQAPQRTTSDTLPNLLFFDSKRPLRILVCHASRLAD